MTPLYRQPYRPVASRTPRSIAALRSTVPVASKNSEIGITPVICSQIKCWLSGLEFTHACKNNKQDLDCMSELLGWHLVFENLEHLQHKISLYPPQTLFVVGYTVFTLSVRASVRACVRACVRNVLFS